MRRPLLLAGAWAAGAALLARAEAPGPPARTGGPPLRVLIPARDEAASLPRLLASLATQTRPADTVLVVDDDSGDGTGALARAAGVEVLTSTGPPPGWSGKCAALHRGQAAVGDGLLVLLDADVVLAPDALARLAGAHAAMGGRGIVSAEPWHDAGRRRERLSAVANLVALMGSGAFGPGRRRVRRRARMAFGPCLVIDRATYEAAGGHAHPDVRSKITEDLALARRVRALGLPVTAFAGRQVVAFRMYPEGVRQAWDGWTKVLATGAAAGPALAVAGAAAWVSGGCVAAAGGARAVGAMARGRRPERADAAAYLAWAAQVAVLGRRAGRFGLATGAAFPAPMAFFVGASARSAVRIGLGRELAWRGRRLTGR